MFPKPSKNSIFATHSKLKERCQSEGLLWRVSRTSELDPKDSILESWSIGLKDSFEETAGKFEYNLEINYMFYSYIIKSLKDGKYYYGSTNNIASRLLKHNKGDVKSTKNRRPFEMHFFEIHQTRSEAFKREMFYKSIEGYQYLKINGIN